MGPCFVLLLLLALVVVLVVLVLRRRRGPAVALPSCGQCGYAVRGLPTFTCPECGADLREVGIVTPTERRPLSPWWRVAIWSVLLPIPAYLLTIAAFLAVPHVQVVRDSLKLKQPRSGAYVEVVVTTVRQGPRGGQTAPRELTFSLAAPGQEITVLEVDPQDLSYRYRDKGRLVENRSELTTEAILAWMSTANVDTTDLQVQAEAGELLRLARDAARGRRLRSLSTTKFQGLSRGSRTSSGPRMWFGPTVIVFWLVVWLLGLWHFGQRRTPTPVGSRV